MGNSAAAEELAVKTALSNPDDVIIIDHVSKTYHGKILGCCRSQELDFRAVNEVSFVIRKGSCCICPDPLPSN